MPSATTRINRSTPTHKRQRLLTHGTEKKQGGATLSIMKRMFDHKPSENNVVDHISLMNEAVDMDGTLEKSKDVGYNPKSTFIVEDDRIDGNEDDESDEDDVCAICDNGGTLFVCEGKCLRSFHPTVEDGVDSSCRSLGYTSAEYEAMEKIDFYCNNCKYKQHQCFACGNLGSSDESSGAEVFRCGNGACGHFYHPDCVAKLLHSGNGTAAEEHRKKIAAGEQFSCPLHKCHKCKELEVKSVRDLQFAICRRCPRAYHRKCLPRKIAFEEDMDLEKGIVQRAWEGLIPNHRILIYCLKHEIDIEIATPVRNHVKFPGPPRKEKKQLAELNKRSFALKDATGKQISSKPSEGVGKLSGAKQHDLSKKRVENFPSLGSSKKRKIEKTQKVNQRAKRTDDLLNLHGDTKKRMLSVMRNASSSTTLEEMKEKHKAPSTHSQCSEFSAGFTSGKVDGSVVAVCASLQKLEEGSSVKDAQTFCGTDILSPVMKWKIVEMLHWYVQDGDMIVDFCCGSNDFGCLMKKKLDEGGKICSFKNYDILQAKNDFNFEKKDWIEVRTNELLHGSQLIMGLHLPFGVNAVLVDKFVNKALEFKPKLLILIAPRETQRLDEKDFPYDLIWENDQMFNDNSFYLPGSIDANGEQIEDWNLNPPILYLWSCRDWTPKHKAIAEQQGHLSGSQKNSQLEERQHGMHVSDYPQESHNIYESLTNHHEDDDPDNKKETMARETITPTNHKEDSAYDSCGTEGDKNRAYSDKLFSGRKRKRHLLMDDDDSSSKDSVSHHPSPKRNGDKPVDTHSSEHLERSLHTKTLYPREKNVSDSTVQSEVAFPGRDKLNSCSHRDKHPSNTPPDSNSVPRSRSRSRSRVRPLGFASVPCRPNSQENTAGWLDE